MIKMAVIEKKGGPYTKDERNKRQNEVFKLHFDLGYSAVKISEIMKANRNTINSDINYWYSILSKEWNNYDTDSWCMKQVHRLESQRARLFKELEKVEGTSLKLSIEKMILDVDTRMMNFVSKSLSISEAVRSNTVNEVNKWANENHQKFRLVEASSLLYATKNYPKN